MSEIKVGSRVVFKTWAEMEMEYGRDGDNIPCRAHFTRPMENTVDRSQILTVKEICENGRRVYFEEYHSLFGYRISLDMIKLYKDDMELVKVEEGSKEPDTFDIITGLVPILEKVPDYMNQNIDISGTTISDERKFGRSLIKLIKLIYHPHAKGSLMYYGVGLHDLLSSSTVIKKDFSYILKIVYTPEQKEQIISNANFEVIPFETSFLCIDKNEKGLIIGIPQDVNAAADKTIKGILESFLKVENTNGEVHTDLCQMILDGNFQEIHNWLRDIERREKIEKISGIKETFIKREYDNKVADLNNRLDIERRNVSGFMNQLESSYQKIKQLNKDILFLDKDSLNANANEFFETILENIDNIEDLSINGLILTMRIIVPFAFFDDDDVPCVLDNLLSDCRTADVEEIVTDVLNRKVILLIDQGVYIDFANNTVCRSNNWDEYSYRGEDTKMRGVPNPHIFFHNCWDMNKVYIKNYMEENNYVLAFEQIKSALAGVNITEGPTTNPWMRNFHRWSHIHCLQNPETGELYNFEEYLEAKKANETT